MAEINVNTFCDNYADLYNTYCYKSGLQSYVSDHKPIESIVDDMRILSFNIAGGGLNIPDTPQEYYYNIEKRIITICKFILDVGYDIICLQEVTIDTGNTLIHQLGSIYSLYQNVNQDSIGNHYNVIFVKKDVERLVTGNVVSGSILIDTTVDVKGGTTETRAIERCNTLTFIYKNIQYHIINCKFPNTDDKKIELLDEIITNINNNELPKTFIIAGDFNIKSPIRNLNVKNKFNIFVAYLGGKPSLKVYNHIDYIFITSALQPLPAQTIASSSREQSSRSISRSPTVEERRLSAQPESRWKVKVVPAVTQQSTATGFGDREQSLRDRDRSRSPNPVTAAQRMQRQSLQQAVVPAAAAHQGQRQSLQQAAAQAAKQAAAQAAKQAAAPAAKQVAAPAAKQAAAQPKKQWVQKQGLGIEDNPKNINTHNMFYAKYLKYKQKYLELKNQYMR